MKNRRRRHVLQHILNNPALRRELFARVIVATQAREGISTSFNQAYSAYDKILLEKT